jgi:hypothetical protein
MAITARVVGDVLMSAVFTPRNMSAERSCAAALNGTHDLQLIKADMPHVYRTPGCSMIA